MLISIFLILLFIFAWLVWINRILRRRIWILIRYVICRTVNGSVFLLNDYFEALAPQHCCQCLNWVIITTSLLLRNDRSDETYYVIVWIFHLPVLQVSWWDLEPIFFPGSSNKLLIRQPPFEVKARNWTWKRFMSASVILWSPALDPAHHIWLHPLCRLPLWRHLLWRHPFWRHRFNKKVLTVVLIQFQNWNDLSNKILIF